MMILDHICYRKEADPRTGRITIQASYCIDSKSITAIGMTEELYKKIKIELAKQIQKEMIKDLSGYFKDDSFNEKDIEYITNLTHKDVEEIRKLRELTKWMSIDEVEKVLHTYEALTDLIAMLGKE